VSHSDHATGMGSKYVRSTSGRYVGTEVHCGGTELDPRCIRELLCFGRLQEKDPRYLDLGTLHMGFTANMYLPPPVPHPPAIDFSF
jgi:hypothetical protein